MSSYAHGQVGAIQEPHSAVLERALADGRCVADLRGLYIHETRRRSDGHVDGVTVASRRVDAIAATASSSSSFLALRQHRSAAPF